MSTSTPAPRGLAYRVGRGLAKFGLWSTLGVGALIAIGAQWASRDSADAPPPQPAFTPTVATDAAKVEAGRAALVEKCAADRAENVARYRKLFADRDYTGAKQALGPCPSVAGDDELARLVADAERAHQAAVDASAKKVAAAEKAKKKREGVSLGMTPDDVLASSWGKPQSVNRTTTATGVREQWVYGGRNYLYFTDGKLTAIQN